MKSHITTRPLESLSEMHSPFLIELCVMFNVNQPLLRICSHTCGGEGRGGTGETLRNNNNEVVRGLIL